MPQSLYNDQMAYFIHCIRNHITPNPGAVEGWTNMKVIDAAYQSAKIGRVIMVG
jgi:predicted dehydrogenase